MPALALAIDTDDGGATDQLMAESRADWTGINVQLVAESTLRWAGICKMGYITVKIIIWGEKKKMIYKMWQFHDIAPSISSLRIKYNIPY